MGHAREPAGTELVRRYRDNYSIPPGVELTEEMVLRHWDLERRLTRELLESSTRERWDVFDRAYSTLYSELPWLNAPEGAEAAAPPAVRFRLWTEASPRTSRWSPRSERRRATPSRTTARVSG